MYLLLLFSVTAFAIGGVFLLSWLLMFRRKTVSEQVRSRVKKSAKDGGREKYIGPQDIWETNTDDGVAAKEEDFEEFLFLIGGKKIQTKPWQSARFEGKYRGRPWTITLYT